jgi:hypothetical protein
MAKGVSFESHLSPHARRHLRRERRHAERSLQQHLAYRQHTKMPATHCAAGINTS